MSNPNFKTLLAELKQKFVGEPAPPPADPNAPPAPAPEPPAPSYQLADGTPVSIDKLEVGGMMQIGGVPAPAGEHQLADGENGAPGTKVTTDASGMITNVVVAAPAPAPPVPPMDFSTPAGVASAYSKFADNVLDNATMSLMLKTLFQDRFSWDIVQQEKTDAIEAYRQSFEAQKQETATIREGMRALVSLMEEIAEQGTEKPVDTRKSMFSKQEDKDRGERRREAIAKL